MPEVIKRINQPDALREFADKRMKARDAYLLRRRILERRKKRVGELGQ
jgi:hypothetical protein